jgi:membrane-associated phospholipid phosphatase
MNPEIANPATLRRLDRLIWAIVAMVATIILVALAVTSFRIEWRTFAAAGATVVILSAGAWIYRNWRPDQRLASALGCTAQLVAFSTVGAILSYLVAAVGAAFPLHDAMFEAADRALGLDWRGMLAWMNEQTLAHFVFMQSYMSFSVQATATILMLAFFSRLVHIRVFMLSLMLSALVCMAISGVLPAQGVWGFYNLNAADYPAIIPATREAHLPMFHGLRDGTYRVISGGGMEGIITFPSFHAALAVVFMVALWPIPVVRWFGIAINSLMIVATPIDGGHYFIDVIAGIATAVLCIATARAAATWAGHAPASLSTSKIPQLAGSEQ